MREHVLHCKRELKKPQLCLSNNWLLDITYHHILLVSYMSLCWKLQSGVLSPGLFWVQWQTYLQQLSRTAAQGGKEWRVDNKVVFCVSDNAANTKTKTKAIQALKWTHQPCLAHAINLFVRDALKVLKPTLDKVKTIVIEFFHRSTTAIHKLKSKDGNAWV